jgi:hypothetical protein
MGQQARGVTIIATVLSGSRRPDKFSPALFDEFSMLSAIIFNLSHRSSSGRSMTGRRGMAAVIGGVLALSGLSTASAESSSGNAAKILETFSAGVFRYQIVALPCVKKEKTSECPIAVNLLKNGRRLDREILPQAAANRKFVRRPIDPGWTYRLFDAAPKLRVWTSGYENDYVGVLARAVPLGATHRGLLITQLTGFERLHRDHLLYAVENNKLKKLWSFSEDPSGRIVWSSVYPVIHQNQNYLLFWQGAQGYSKNSGDDEPDSEQASLLNWPAGKNVIEAMPLPAKELPLYLVVSSFYSSVAQARDAVRKIAGKEVACPESVASNILALATAEYPKLTRQEKAFSGSLFFTKSQADDFQQELTHCTPAIKSETFILN